MDEAVTAPGEGLSDEELDVWRDIAKPMGAEGMVAPVLRTLFARMDTAESSVAALRDRAEELGQRDQRWVDEVCAYRNLAIFLGAKPTDMLNEYDRKLCESGIDTGFAPGDSTTADARAETADLWAENEALRERAERAEGLGDERLDIARRTALVGSKTMPKATSPDSYETLAQIIARLDEAELERDELVWLLEHQGFSIHRGDFVRSDGTRTTMVVKVSEPARLATLLAAALEKES